MKGAALVFATLLITAAPAHALPRRLPPIEQCSGDRSFVQFRNKLSQVVARKDRAALLTLLAPDVQVNFGGETGLIAFAKEWSFDPGEHENIWNQLKIMLSLGCARLEEARMIPSLTVQLDSYESDDVYDLVLILPGAKLYESAGVESAKPATTPWELAAVTSRVADWGTGVRLADGREGYIPDDRVYAPLGYRMLIKKRGGKWMITAFVAGD